MLASRLYSPTLREIPADAVVISHKYMLKARSEEHTSELQSQR